MSAWPGIPAFPPADIRLTWGGAPLHSPHFTGQPTAPTPGNFSLPTRIATTGFVEQRVTHSIEHILSTYPFVMGNNLDKYRVATTDFVMQAIAGSVAGVLSFNTRDGAVVFQATDITGAGGALLNSPAFIGSPTAFAPPLNDNSNRLATTEWVTTSSVIAALDTRVQSLENLGSFAGSFDTRAQVPTNVSGFPTPPQINDFVNVRADETQSGYTTRYVITAIAGDGTITWTFDLRITTDISGKMDLVVPAPTVGNLAQFAALGQVADAGMTLAAKMNVVTPAPASGNVASFGTGGQVIDSGGASATLLRTGAAVGGDLAGTLVNPTVPKIGHIYRVESLPSGVGANNYCRIAELFDNGTAWYDFLIHCDIYPNFAGWGTPLKLQFRASRGGTANANIGLAQASLAGANVDFRPYAYIQKEADGFVRVYVRGVTGIRGRRIVFYWMDHGGSPQRLEPSIGLVLTSLPAAAVAGDVTTGLLPLGEVIGDLAPHPAPALNRGQVAPYPFQHLFNGSSQLGLKLRCPRKLWQGGMFYFTVRVFMNYNTADIAISGYLFAGAPNGSAWLHIPRAQMISGNNAHRVIIGMETDGTLYVWIGAPATSSLTGNTNYSGLAVFNHLTPSSPADWNAGWSVVRTSTDADMPNRSVDRLVYPPQSGDWYNYQNELVPADGIRFYSQARSCAFESNGTQVIVTQLLEFGGPDNMLGTPPVAFNWGAGGSHAYPVSGIRAAFRPNNSIYFPCTIIPFGVGAPVAANLQPAFPAYCSVDNSGRLSVAFGARPGWPFGGYIFMHFTYFPGARAAWDLIPAPAPVVAPNPLQ